MARDNHLYKITYSNGKVKLADRRVLGCVIGAHKNDHWGKHPVAIGRAEMPEFEDVTDELLGDDG